MADNDITRTGSKGYKELQNLNNANFNSAVADRTKQIFNKYNEYAASREFSPEENAEHKVRSSLYGTSNSWGQSMFDNNTANANEFEQVQDTRANNQPWYAKLGAGILKAGVLAGTTFLDGTLGLVYGGAKAIQEGRWSAIWDNEVSDTLQAINEESEKWLPNYYTKNEEMNPLSWDAIVSANFLGDKLIKNLGFTVGAFYTGGLVSGGIRGLGEAAMIGAKRLGATMKTINGIKNTTKIVAGGVGASLSALNEGRIEANTNSRDWFNLKKAQLYDATQARRAEIQAEWEANAGKEFKQGADGKMIDVAYEKYKAKIAKEEEVYNASIAQAQEDRLNMGNADLAMNIPILTASNIIQFGRMFANGFKTAKTNLNILGDLGTMSSGTAKMGKLVKALKVTKGALSEGNEEMLQSAASNIAGNYYSTDVDNFYKRAIDPKAGQEQLSWIKYTTEGLKETLGDEGAWEGFITGAITGALGMPRFRGAKNAQGKWQSPITFEGGIVGEWKDLNKQQAREEEVVSYLNRRAEDPTFRAYYQGLMRHNSYEKDKQLAAQLGDKFEFENADHAQLITDMVMLDAAGKLGDIKQVIEEASGTTDADLDSIVANTTNKTENGKLTGPFAEYATTDEGGNVIANFGNQEDKDKVKNKILSNKKELLDTVKEYQEIKENFELNYPELKDKQLSEYIWMQSQINNWKKRNVSMSKEIKLGIGNVIGSIDQLLRLSKQIRTSEAQSSTGLTEVYLLMDKNIQKLENIISNLNILRDLDETTLAYTLANQPELTEMLIEQINKVEDRVMSAEEKDAITTKLNDLIRSGKALNIYSTKLKEYLENPQERVEAHAKMDEEAIKKDKIKKASNLKESLKAATNLQEFKDILNNQDEPENIETALSSLEEEGHELAKNYKETTNYNNEVSKALNTANLDVQTRQDALKLLQDHSDNSNTLKEIANPNSVWINNENAFDEDSNGDVELSSSRFHKAQYALQQAIAKVNSDAKFKDRFSEKKEAPTETPKATAETSQSNKKPIENKSNKVDTAIGDVSTDDAKGENKQTNDKSSSQRLDNDKKEGKRTYYRPAIPELHIGASKEGDFRAFNIVAAERQPGVNFDTIYNYLRDKGAFDYINEGHLKVGDSIGFMIDPEFEKQVEEESWHTQPTIFLIDTRNGQVVGSLDEGRSVNSFEGLAGLEEKIRKEYQDNKTNKAVSNAKFVASSTTKVSQIMVGKVPISNEEKKLKDIPNVSKENNPPVFGVIKNGVLSTNGKLEDSQVVKPVDMSNKEGAMYLLIPNAAGKYTPMRIWVSHFNRDEFNPANVEIQETQVYKNILESVEAIARVNSESELDNAVAVLGSDLYLGNTHIDWFSSNAGNGIRFTKVLKDAQGNEIYEEKDGKKVRKEESRVVFLSEKSDPNLLGSITGDNEVTEATAKSKSISSITEEIINILLDFNLPIQVNLGMINKGSYNNMLVNSGVLTSNITDARVIDSWFITDYFDNKGNLHSATKIASIKPVNSQANSTPVGGTEGAIQGIKISYTTFGGDLYIDLNTNTIRDKNGKTIIVDDTIKSILLDLAWAQNNFGDTTNSEVMIDNKVVTPEGKVLDRTTKKYIKGQEAQKVKDALIDRKKNKESKAAKSEQVISEIYENQQKVDKERTDNEYYYIQEEDGEYHQYSRVHNRLGDNRVDNAKNTNSTNSQTALEAGTAVDSIIRQYFTIKDVSKIVKPSNMTSQAFIDLLTSLNSIKENIEQMGERFLTNNIVLYHKYPDGTRVAGEVDILSVDKDGNFKIYDVKTSRYSFGEFTNKRGDKVNYFENPSSTQRMSTKDYYTLQLSAYKNLFESQYNTPVTTLAILPFVLNYDNGTVVKVSKEKGIRIAYNPAVNVPLVGISNSSTSESPIFDTTAEILNPVDTILPEYNLEDSKVGYYVKDGKIYKGYLSSIGEINGVGVHITKIPNITKGFGKSGKSHTASNTYLAVFPNGATIEIISNDPMTLTEQQAKDTVTKILSGNPQRVVDMSKEKTLIYDSKNDLDNNLPPTKPSGAANTIQKEQAAIPHDEEFEDEFTLRRVDDTEATVWNQEKELNWIVRVLPQLSKNDRVQVVKGLIKVGKQGALAWGQFDKGVITLSDIAAEGTTYHEAFHAVFNLLLDNNERQSLYDEAKKLYGDKDNLSLEEDMAEGFREYIMTRQDRGLGKRILDFFKELFTKVTNWNNLRPSLINYYRRINEGKYADSTFKVPTISELRGATATTTSFNTLSDTVQENLLKKGWTAEKFDSISQEERDKAIECIAF